MIATKLKENATKKNGARLGTKNSATGTENIFRALMYQQRLLRTLPSKATEKHTYTFSKLPNVETLSA